MRAREFLTENLIPAHTIYDQVAAGHREPDDLSDGDLTDRVYWFDTYKLTTLPISSLDLDEYWLDEDLIEDYIEYIKDSRHTMPPIVYDPIGKSMIDGMHRANAYARLGHADIPAYVGVQKSEDYGNRASDYDHDEDEDLTEYKVDNDQGLGSVPSNANIDYEGLRVLMKPSIFLELAAPLKNPTSVDHIAQHLDQGGALGSPFLLVSIPEEWFDGKFADYAKVTGHEGRNRMLAVQRVHGDDPVEVHILPRNGLRRRHLTTEIIEQLQVGMRKQDGSGIVFGRGSFIFDLI